MEMKIIKEQTRFYNYAFEFSFDWSIVEYCRHIKELLGYRAFSFYEKKWRINNLEVIDKLKQRFTDIEIDKDVQRDLINYKLEKEATALVIEKSKELKLATKSNLQIKNIKGELYPYQKIGVEFFINNNGKAILADTMGLGKSAQALAYVAHQKFDRTLIICPASVKYSFESECKKWTYLKPFVIDSKTNLTNEILAEHHIFLINYDILKKFIKTLITVRWDCLIVDEFHFIKSNQAQRTKLVKLIARHIPSILLLSGTPLLSRPVELFNGLYLMDPSVWNNWMEFTKKYCGGRQGYWGWEYKGATNIEELQSKISRYFLRRKKEDVLKELPPKRFIDIPIQLSPEYQDQYEMAVKEFRKYLEEIKKKNVYEIDRSMSAAKLVKLGALRQITTNGKIESAKDIINSIIDSGEKVVVFSVYNKPLECLKKEFDKISVILTGQTSIEDRKDIINKFQNDPNIKIFFGGTKSAGVGITLTAASNVLFIDFSWVPADMQQAEDRIHRIGQTAESINIYQLYARETIDDYMRQLLSKKKEIFDKLIDGTRKNIDVINDLISMIK